MSDEMKTVGEVLVDLLEANGVEVVFGIPGVHTVELYRGLAASKIRHITPRHEQGAGFMADGYARVSGKPGVALVITGPGLTNTITAMAQARQDSIPMLVISGVNRRDSLGHGRDSTFAAWQIQIVLTLNHHRIMRDVQGSHHRQRFTPRSCLARKLLQLVIHQRYSLLQGFNLLRLDRNLILAPHQLNDQGLHHASSGRRARMLST